MNKIVVVVAMKEELDVAHLPDNIPVLFTGVGKINAAISLSMYLSYFKNIETVINYGTAGALRSGIEGLCEVSTVVQRDVDLRALGLDIGQMLGERKEDSVIELGKSGISLGTGDSFVVDKPAIMTDAVDMEAFALAKVCLSFNKTFKCFKYISDFADCDAATDWNTKIQNGSKLFADHIIKVGLV